MTDTVQVQLMTTYPADCSFGNSTFENFNVIDSILAYTDSPYVYYLFLLSGNSHNAVVIPLSKANNYTCPNIATQIWEIDLLTFFEQTIQNNLPIYSVFNCIHFLNHL